MIGEGESKAVLLVRLLNAIDQGRHSFEDLKDRSAVGGRRPSTRSLRRYLAILGDAGFPLYFDRAANAYRFAEGYSHTRLDLTSGELFGLVALRSLSASIGGTIGASDRGGRRETRRRSAGSGARARVEAVSPVAFRLSEIRLDEQGERAFALLSSAERASRSVRFSYLDKEGKASSRVADPYGFILNAGRIYCVAHDHTRKDKRTFAVDSISEPLVLAKTFQRPDDFNVEAYAAASISGVLHADHTTDVRVRFAPRVANAAIAARVVAERRVKQAKDGSTEITYRVGDVDELVRWVLGWGAQAEIVGPRAARTRIAALAKEIAAKYK